MKYPSLFEPLTIRGVTYRNRIFSAPMTFRDLPGDGNLPPEAAAFYEQRARGGAAEVIVSELTTNGVTGRTYPNNTSADTPFVKVGLAVCADAIRRHGANPSVELNHGGKYAIGNELFGPSGDVLPDGRTVREMTKADIDRMIGEFASAAKLAKEAGFRSALIHVGHGWLLHQFFSPADNKRTDSYGGSLLNRARLTLEVLEAVRGAVGESFPLELRLSADEFRENGYTFTDVIELAKLVENRVDILHISTGSHENSFHETHQTMFVPRGGLVKFAAAVKEQVHIPVAAIGAIGEPEMAEEIIRSGKADIVVMGRQLIADPMFPRKAMEGREEDITRCCRCFTCQGERMVSGLRVCALNPTIGREAEIRYDAKAPVSKNVLVVGGGPAGMSAALSAAERGHTVTLCEKSEKLGGALKDERNISFKQDLYRWISVKERALRAHGVDIRLNTEVTAEYAKSLTPDAVIVAAGTEPLIPKIPGIELAIPAPEALERELGKNIVVIGGGLVGCELSMELCLQGKTVTVLEMGDAPCRDANPRHGPILLERLKGQASILCRTKAVEITSDGVICDTPEGKKTLPADSVICAAGRVRNTDIYKALLGTAPWVVPVGDCISGGSMMTAVSAGFTAGRDI